MKEQYVTLEFLLICTMFASVENSSIPLTLTLQNIIEKACRLKGQNDGQRKSGYVFFIKIVLIEKFQQKSYI